MALSITKSPRNQTPTRLRLGDVASKERCSGVHAPEGRVGVDLPNPKSHLDGSRCIWLYTLFFTASQHLHTQNNNRSISIVGPCFPIGPMGLIHPFKFNPLYGPGSHLNKPVEPAHYHPRSLTSSNDRKKNLTTFFLPEKKTLLLTRGFVYKYYYLKNKNYFLLFTIIILNKL